MTKHAEDYSPFTSLSGSYLVNSKIDRVKFIAVMRKVVPLTDTARAPWDVVDVEGVENTVKKTVAAIT